MGGKSPYATVCGRTVGEQSASSSLVLLARLAPIRFLEAGNILRIETALRLVQNAFFKAILPGFEREVSQPGGSHKRKPASS
jgi:hypothetical protein